MDIVSDAKTVLSGVEISDAKTMLDYSSLDRFSSKISGKFKLCLSSESSDP